ncbi:hypothetical protein P3102_22510 [Amycolatopsis sp. QT-25]|uniref:hypothetical protein n=1 Tax=Amycolatopsis sp. QT-25 TaxID=3034022 RepID=UPI0023EB05DD|nr:hypothetical protein [Amycolatopsis sp. QT-25]WET76879.1 hypothetical protein P3102_22510 [Amycolatopsis sp. QT-25]
MNHNVIEWWVLYRYTELNNHLDGYPQGTVPRTEDPEPVTIWEPSIVRLLADMTTGSEPCVFCFERKQATCPGMALHVAMERDRAELEAGAELHTAKVKLPDGLDWRLAMLAIKRLILDRKVISQQ